MDTGQVCGVCTRSACGGSFPYADAGDLVILTASPLPKPSFSDTYVFPDGQLVPINETLHTAEISGFEARDVESLREHYALTLKRWVQRLEDHAEQARRITNDTTYRIWRLLVSPTSVSSAFRFRRSEGRWAQAARRGCSRS